MRIGINARFLLLKTTGIGVMLRNYLEEFATNYPEHTFILFLPKDIGESKTPNFKYVYVPENPGPSSFTKTFWEKMSLPGACKKQKCDLLWSPYPSVTNVEIPHVMTIHDTIPWTDRRYQRFRTNVYYKWVLAAVRQTSHLHFVSRATRAEFGRLFPDIKKPSSVIYNSVNLPQEIPEGLPNLPKNPYLFYIGGFDPRKNVETLIKLWAKYIAPYEDTDLVLAGKPPKQNRLSKKNGLHSLVSSHFRERLHLVGYISEEEKFAWMKNSLGYVNFSSAEGFNLPLLEAISMQTPALVSDLEVHKEVGGEAAIYAPLSDTHKTVNLLRKFVCNEELRNSLAKKAETRKKIFSQKKSADELMNLFNNIAEINSEKT